MLGGVLCEKVPIGLQRVVYGTKSRKPSAVKGVTRDVESGEEASIGEPAPGYPGRRAFAPFEAHGSENGRGNI